MNAVVLANFDVNEKDKQITFQNNGWWYEYFSGDSINVTGNYNFSLGPGEYRLYTDTKLSMPNILNTVSINDYEIANWEVEIYPNPSTNILNVNIKDFENQEIKYTIINSSGKILRQENKFVKEMSLNIEDLEQGNYYLIIQQNNNIISKEFIKL